MNTAQDAIGLFKLHHPKSLGDMIDLGLSPVYLSRGCDRSVYKLDDLVVKIENDSSYVAQTKNEIDAILRINKEEKLESLRKHIPPLFYADPEIGVLVTKYYQHRFPMFGLDEELRRLQKALNDIGVSDLHTNNFCVDDDNTVIAIDLGFYHER